MAREHIVNSYVARWDDRKGKVVVDESHWQPGYTPAHRSTPSSAISHLHTIVKRDISHLNHIASMAQYALGEALRSQNGLF